MSEIKALKKLREWLDYKINRFDVGENALLLNTGADPNELYDIADEIEAEIERDYMRLPTDMDDEPIHIGDEMQMKHGQIGTVVAIGETQFTVHATRQPNVVCQAKCHRHVKPDPLRELLVEMVDYYGDTNLKAESVVDEYIERIRDLLGGDAE